MTIRRVHYDLTDLCNAGCPQCARTDPDGCRPRPWLAKRALSLADFQRLSPPDFVAGLENALFCGNYGEPAVVPDLIPILAYCWRCNPLLKIQVYSNASIRSVAWWRELAAEAAGHSFRVVAAIDGASHETNRRYRIGTDFARIMENMAAYIGGGGMAEWAMLVFRHNEHEVETAERMARERGFVGFRAYPSDRFAGQPAFRYSHRGAEQVLEPPTEARAPKNPSAKRLPADELRRTEVVISCAALRSEEAFIDFLGYLSPCCHIGRRLYLRDQGGIGADAWLGGALDAFGPGRLNIDAVGFEAARAAYDAFLVHLEAYWARQQPPVCKTICGKKRAVVA